MPRSPSVSHLNKIVHTVGVSAFFAFYSALWPTLYGALIGIQIENINLDVSDLKHDMITSATSMATLGMLYHPIQYHHEFESFNELINQHPYWAMIIFLNLSVIIPLVVNNMTRENEFPERTALASGGVIAQVIAFVLFIVIKQLMTEFKNSPDENNYSQRSVSGRSINTPSISLAIADNSYNESQLFNPNLSRLSVRRIMRNMKLAILKPLLKFSLNHWYNEFQNPMSLNLVNNFSRIEQDDENDIQHLLANLEEKHIAQSIDSLYFQKRMFSRKEKECWLTFNALQEQNKQSFENIHILCTALIGAIPVNKNIIAPTSSPIPISKLQKNVNFDEKVPMAIMTQSHDSVGSDADIKHEPSVTRRKKKKKKKNKAVKIVGVTPENLAQISPPTISSLPTTVEPGTSIIQMTVFPNTTTSATTSTMSHNNIERVSTPVTTIRSITPIPQQTISPALVSSNMIQTASPTSVLPISTPELSFTSNTQNSTQVASLHSDPTNSSSTPSLKADVAQLVINPNLKHIEKPAPSKDSGNRRLWIPSKLKSQHPEYQILARTSFKLDNSISNTKMASNANMATFFQPASTEPLQLGEAIQIILSDIENKVFALLDSLLPAHKNTYKSYIVGGWAYDRVREAVLNISPCQFNDIDLVTEIPTHILSGLFKSIPEVKGLFCGKFHDFKLDIVHEPDLSNLTADVMKRDFMTFYLDKTGKVIDPAGFSMTNLRLNFLYGPSAPDVMFNQEPLTILRAIYVATKRGLSLDHYKPSIIAARATLIPQHDNINPHRMNLRMAKLFTQHLAIKSLALLLELGLLETIFPTIFADMFAGLEWIQFQIANTNAQSWPKLSLIYASLIAPAVIHRNPNLPYSFNHDPNYFDDNIMALVTEIGNSSPLFQDAFKDPNELYFHLRWPLKMYSEHYMQKFLTLNVGLGQWGCR